MGLLSQLFRKTAVDRAADAWWQRADEAASNPTAAAVAALRADVSPDVDDEAERQVEMLGALQRLLERGTGAALPQIATQHRVIGSDVCHFAAPASLAGAEESPGKVFLTSRRLVFAGGKATAWPWHRIRTVGRVERDLVVVGGDHSAVRLRFNSYADALEAASIARRLTSSS